MKSLPVVIMVCARQDDFSNNRSWGYQVVEFVNQLLYGYLNIH
ncbi:MAG: hypothetical protein ACR5K4_01440 [Sodalis sp. (in: enterobacteria)]